MFRSFHHFFHATGSAGFLIGLVMSIHFPVAGLAVGSLGACLLAAACVLVEAKAA